MYAPAVTPTSFVLFLSGESGWDERAQSLALELRQQGAMVAGIDLPKLQANLDADPAQCVFPDGDLENLSHFVQAYFHGSTYLTPMLVGLDAGATLAYAVLAQAPRDTFSSALTVDFCPASPMIKPLCKGSGVESAPAAHGSGTDYLPIKSLGNPWVALHTPTAKGCAAASADFIANVHGAARATVPVLGSGSGSAICPSWKSRLAPARRHRTSSPSSCPAMVAGQASTRTSPPR